MPPGYFRIVSFRSPADVAPEPGETVIDMDRSHPCLGNNHYLRNKNDKVERAKVIKLHRQDLVRDLNIKGPMYHALLAIAKRIAGGERICGRCWCHPQDCHLDNYVPVLGDMVGDILGQSPGRY